MATIGGISRPPRPTNRSLPFPGPTSLGGLTVLTTLTVLAPARAPANTGGVAGQEVVQLYVRDDVGSVTRPVRELRGFHRIRLGPGQSRTVRFTVRRQ